MRCGESLSIVWSGKSVSVVLPQRTEWFISLAARGGNLAKIPLNEVIDDFGRGSSVESESE